MSFSYQRNIPLVIQPSDTGERQLDIYSPLLTEKIIFLQDESTDETANLKVAQMLFLDAEDSRKITLYINSFGGLVTVGMAVYDAINQIRSQVCTVCIGAAASMGAFLLSFWN